MQRKVLCLAGLLTFLLVVWLVLNVNWPGHTRLDLAEAETGRKVFSAVLRDGEPITLTWRNSLFSLDVTEAFVTQDGTLIQTQVTFADPNGAPPPRVSPFDVDDLYHTGGPFTAQGLHKPFQQVVYRVGEIGHPRLSVRGQVLDLKQAVGFGGRLILTARRAKVFEGGLSESLLEAAPADRSR